MKEEQLELDGLIVTFEYEKRQAEPEVGYLVDWWHYDIISVELMSFYLMTEPLDILDILPTDVLARINEQIEEYLKRK